MLHRSKIIYQYYHQASGKTITMRPIDLHRDLDQLFEWVHHPHTIPNWQLNKPKVQLYQHFRKAQENRHQSLFIVAVDQQELCYAETYFAPYDRLANFCEVSADDYGLHLLIGPPHAIGQGYSELILCTLTDYLFTYHRAKRVLVEPNHRMQQMSILERKLGFSNLGFIKLPEKKAILYAAEAEHFYSRYPK